VKDQWLTCDRCHQFVAVESGTVPSSHDDHRPSRHWRRGYFGHVIDIPALRTRIEAGASRVVVDASGELLDQTGASESGPALLIAAPLTDAVKVVVGGLVHESLDRDALWSIAGFVLGREVVLALGDDVTTPAGLIEAVTGAGFEWQVISPSSSSI
jgi:hypothetical protein